MLGMKLTLRQRIVNSVIWIACGVVVAAVRALFPQGGLTFVWEIIGGGMIVYGTVRLVWTVKSSTSPTIP